MLKMKTLTCSNLQKYLLILIGIFPWELLTFIYLNKYRDCIQAQIILQFTVPASNMPRYAFNTHQVSLPLYFFLDLYTNPILEKVHLYRYFALRGRYICKSYNSLIALAISLAVKMSLGEDRSVKISEIV